MPNPKVGKQTTGSESGRFYCIQNDSAFLVTSMPCKGKEVRANKDYVCGACQKTIPKGET